MDTYINNLYQKIKKISKIDIKYNIDKIDKLPLYIYNLKNSEHVPKQISKNLLINTNIYSIKFKYDKLNIKITMVIKKNKKETKYLNDIEEILKRIIYLYELSEKKSKILRIVFFFNTSKKNMPKNEYLKTIHVNSALSEISEDKNEYGNILIWRYEEYLKVLIHELLHSMNYDYNLINSNINDIFKKLIDLSDNYNINEAWTEFVTTILHFIIYLVHNNKEYKYFKNMINEQKKYSLCQANIIYNHSFRNGIFYQHTSVFSYYIIKYCLLLSINNIFKKIDNIYITKKNKMKVIKIIVNCYKIGIQKVKNSKCKNNINLKMLYN